LSQRLGFSITQYGGWYAGVRWQVHSDVTSKVNAIEGKKSLCWTDVWNRQRCVSAFYDSFKG